MGNSHKRAILCLLLVCVALVHQSQINYNFTAVSSAFTPNSGGTVLHAAGVDDALSAAVNIGFTFQYGCTNYTQFKVSSNGWMSFNTALTSSNLSNNLNTATERPTLGPLWDDLLVGTGGTVNYVLTGTAPNRVLTVEWLNMKWYYAASAAGISFQCKLYETSNRIEFIYRPEAGGIVNASASIGISGPTSGDYYSLNNTSTSPTASKVFETTTINTSPASGQVYRWDPIACSGTPVGGTAVSTPSSSCGTFNSTLTLSGSSSGCGVTYQWQSATTLGGPYSNVVGATNSTLAVTNSATTYYQCIVSCSGSTATSTPATATITSGGSCNICNMVTIGSLPFTLTGQTNCGQGNNVTSTNVTNICGSSLYYGGEDASYAFTPTSSGVITASVTSTGSWMGITLYAGCPTTGGTCVGYSQSSLGNQSLCATVNAGVTYYFVIDSWPAPTCNPYNIGISAPGSCSGSYTSAIAANTPANGCSSYNTSLSLSGYSGCGVTLQWQSASSSAGPWTNITGATSATTVVPVTATTYYRAVLSCGTSTAASNTVTANMSAAGVCGVCGSNTIASLPFTITGQTNCGNGNNVSTSNVTNICGSSLYYGGEDATWAFTPTTSGAITVSVSSTGFWVGVTLYQNCPNAGGTCVGYSQSSSGTQTICATVTAGQTYYVVIDSWPAPNCNPYDLSISAPSACGGTIAGATAAASPNSGCGSVNTTLSLSNYSGCGITFQWQSSLSSAGPFTNITGATNSSYATTATVTTYYQAVLSCGSTTASSNVVQVSISGTTVPVCSMSTYTVAPVTYSFETFTGTTLPTTDDVLFTTIINFGFPFCFGGGQYWGGYIASNCAFVFDAVPCFPNILFNTYAAGGVGTGWSITNGAPINGTSIPRNAVLAPWQDTHPGLGGTMRYYTTGTAPNRKFVVSYENIPMYSCGTSSPSIYFTGQIKLFESNYAIEIHVGNKGVCPGWNNGQAILGLHSYDGTIYVPPVNATMHNATSVAPYNQWTMTNTAYRFQSPCGISGPCTVLPIEFRKFYGECVNGVNQLHWETASENNIKDFTIERSTDAVNFTPIGYMLPNNKPSAYGFNDQAYRPGVVNYYRITATEYSGQKKSTFVYPIGDVIGDLTISEVFPNPAAESYNITVSTKTPVQIKANVRDTYGRMISSTDHTCSQGMTVVTLDTPATPGFYVVEILYAGKVLSQQKLSVIR